MITVVIPYFQRSEGILRKALASVSAQLAMGLSVHVIVVDDESPIPADLEVGAVTNPAYTIQVIKQVNAGPGAARNSGLANAPAATQYIAFLDSDDEWSPDHLQRAVLALDCGFDFYFADHLQLGTTVSAFQRSNRLTLTDHPLIPARQPNLYRYAGDLIDQTIRGNLIGTSTVVFRFAPFREKRFRVEFTNAGEDYLFWMDLIQGGASAAFSTQCEAIYGRGVNVYAGSGWGTEKYVTRIHNELKYRKLTKQLFPLNKEQLKYIRMCERDLRLEFSRDCFYRLRHRKGLSWNMLIQHFKLDPLSFISLPINFVQVVRARDK